MKKLYALPLAALAFAAACDDSSKGLLAPEGPQFHAGAGNGNHATMTPTITGPTVLSHVSGNTVTFTWSEPTSPEYSITGYDYQLTCAPAVTGGSCTSDANTVEVGAGVLQKEYTLNGAGSYTFQVRGDHESGLPGAKVKHSSPWAPLEVSVTAASSGGGSVVAPTAQVISFTSSISNARYGGTYTPAATGGGSGNPVVFTVSGVCTIASGVVTFTGVGDCNVHADQAGGTNNGIQYTAANRLTQVIHVGKAVLRVNANAASTPFGVTATLTYTLTGFVFSETEQGLRDLTPTAALSGAPSCSYSLTAVDVHEGAITCIPGTLSATNYSFVTGDLGTLTITAWHLAGYHDPVGETKSIRGRTIPQANTSTIWHNIRGGNTVPLKFNVYTAQGTAGVELDNVTTTVHKFEAVKLASCSAGAADETILSGDLTSGSTSLRYSGVAGVDGQFIQNWATPKVTGDVCYRATVIMKDDSNITAFFKVRK